MTKPGFGVGGWRGVSRGGCGVGAGTKDAINILQWLLILTDNLNVA